MAFTDSTDSPSKTSVGVEKAPKRDVTPAPEGDQEFPSGKKVTLIIFALTLAMFLVALVRTPLPHTWLKD
jgi:hypothetical protein